jgi:peptide/nickel transport system substrate-binding protein
MVHMALTRGEFLRLVLGTGVAASSLGGNAVSAAEPGDAIRKIVIWNVPQAANPQAWEASQLIAQIWRGLGLDVEVRGAPRTQLADVVWYKRDSWDTAMWEMVGRPERTDPDELIYNLFDSKTAATGYNFVGYNNPDYDKVAEQQRVTVDKDQRKQLVDQAQMMVARDQPYLFMVYPKKVFAFNQRVIKADTLVNQPGLGIKNFWSFIQAQPAGTQKDLVLNSTDQLVAISPLYISGATDSWVTELIWDRLMRIGPDNLPQPWAAESVTWADDRNVDVKLRPGMKWHDGQPVTVDDVIFSFTAPAQGNLVPMYKPFVAGIDSVKQTDNLSLRFTLNAPSAAFETATLAKINLVPKHIWDPLMAGIKPGQNVETVVEDKRIGSGPYRFVQWSRQEEVLLQANSDHWAAPKFDRWVLRIIPNIEATMGMFKSGGINFLSDYTGDPNLLLQMVAQNPALKTMDTIDIGFQFLGFNLRRAPFSDTNFRRALSFAVPRKLFVNAAWNGFAEPADSVVSPSLPFWFAKGSLDIPQGPDAAKKILADAGYQLMDGKLHYPTGVKEALAN